MSDVLIDYKNRTEIYSCHVSFFVVSLLSPLPILNEKEVNVCCVCAVVCLEMKRTE